MYHIAVCDDNNKDLELVVSLLAEYQVGYPTFYYKISEFDCVEKLLLEIEDEVKFNLIFLDIYMSGIDGVDGAREIRQRGYEGQIIFQSSSKDFIFAAFAVEAIQYLIKPIQKIQFFQAMDQVLVAYAKDKTSHVTVNVGGEIKKINLDNLKYAETHGNYQQIHLEDNEIVNARITATNLFTLLIHDDRFTQIGRAYILNMEFVDKFTTKDITLLTGEQIYLPRGHFIKFKEAYFEFLV